MHWIDIFACCSILHYQFPTANHILATLSPSRDLNRAGHLQQQWWCLFNSPSVVLCSGVDDGAAAVLVLDLFLFKPKSLICLSGEGVQAGRLNSWVNHWSLDSLFPFSLWLTIDHHHSSQPSAVSVCLLHSPLNWHPFIKDPSGWGESSSTLQLVLTLILCLHFHPNEPQLVGCSSIQAAACVSAVYPLHF